MYERAGRVRVRRHVLEEIAGHARSEAPVECCGLLLGAAGVVEHTHRARNLLGSPRCYLVDPADHFAAIRRARAIGLDVLGAYHSHPVGPAHPSPRDCAEGDASLLYVIAGPLGESPAAVPLTGWRLVAGNFTRVGLVAVP